LGEASSADRLTTSLALIPCLLDAELPPAACALPGVVSADFLTALAAFQNVILAESLAAYLALHLLKNA
jgi:hypothetical protein